MGQVTISLNGRGYRLNCGAGEEDRLRELAAELNLRLERLVGDVGQQGDDRMLVMAALLLTDEWLELKARLEEIRAGADKAELDVEISPSDARSAALLEAPSANRDPSKVTAAATIPVMETGGSANPARPAPQRISLEARLAEARAGRPGAAPKPGPA